MTGCLQIASRPRNCAHAPPAKPPLDCLALSTGQTVGRIRAGRFVPASLRQADSAAAEEGVDSIDPGSPFDVRLVVRDQVEGDELPTGLLAQAKKEVVEDLRPGPGMQGAAVGQNSVEVEEAGTNAFRQTEHPRRHRHRGQPRHRADVGRSGQGGEQLRDLLALPRELAMTAGDLGLG